MACENEWDDHVAEKVFGRTKPNIAVKDRKKALSILNKKLRNPFQVWSWENCDSEMKSKHFRWCWTPVLKTFSKPSCNDASKYGGIP